jgi:hypothetical protein
VWNKNRRRLHIGISYETNTLTRNSCAPTRTKAIHG